jgi:cytosine/creatinine deaminase
MTVERAERGGMRLQQRLFAERFIIEDNMPIRVPTTDSYVLANATVPLALMPGELGWKGATSGLLRCDIWVSRGVISHIDQNFENRQRATEVMDLERGMVLPRFVDIHTHIDKGQILPRTPLANGTHENARMTVGADRSANWSREDVAARMDFNLRCAFAHGTGALRTHIDSIGPQTEISWPLFAEMREAWKGRIALQGVALFPVDFAIDDRPQFDAIVAAVAKHGGLLGGLTFVGRAPDDKLRAALDLIYQAANAHGLDVDFHADESDSVDARTLEEVALASLRAGHKGRTTVGHCCSLSLQSDADRARVIARVAEAGLAIVSLPMCNMYLQDRAPGRTPRWRGVAPLHELDAAGVPALVASDNTRDPFYAYGDMDMLEVFREATRILHLDHSARPWARLLGAGPAEVMGLPGAGTIAKGQAADLVLVGARTFNELLCRPWSDRVVLVGGKAIERSLPAYAELDGRMGA